MKRPAYAMVVAVALLMGVVAVVVSSVLDRPLVDPDGFLGPAWIRLPAMVFGAFLLDVVPRSLWRSRGRLREVRTEARHLVRQHWTRERLLLVSIGLTSFYVTYVSYRNLKNFLVNAFPVTPAWPWSDTGSPYHDALLHRLDKAVFFGQEPATVLQAVFGESWAAHFFAFVYLLYLPLAPVSLVVWLVWSRRISYGYWYATANCLTWVFGTISYYVLPTLGPAFHLPWLYEELPVTGIKSLQKALWSQRQDAKFGSLESSVQSVAGFASLHVALTLVIALVAHYTVRHAVIRWTAWAYFGLTTISTLYFGWHYVADDLAGVLIALLCVYLGGIATGHRFHRLRLVAPAEEERGVLTAEPEPAEDEVGASA